jgi:large subunit ribosomal protein L37Ae
MVKRATYGSVRRLGSRYGRTIRFKLGKVESEQRKKHKCPYCSYVQVRRKTLGIWECKKCGSIFTNKAYTVGKLGSIREMSGDSDEKSSESKNKAVSVPKAVEAEE